MPPKAGSAVSRDAPRQNVQPRDAGGAGEAAAAEAAAEGVNATAGETPRPAFPADAFWRLTPRQMESATPGASPEHSAVVVADLDTRPAAETLRNLKPGDAIELALPNGEITRGHVNLVLNDNGVLRIGGGLPEKERGSFALALDDKAQLMGHILLPGMELAYAIEPGARPDNSRMEALPLGDVICFPYQDPPDDRDADANTDTNTDADAVAHRQTAQASAAAAVATTSSAATAAVPAAAAPAPQATAVPALSSRPTAPAVLYLDFDGAVVNDPYWNRGATINAAAADLTDDQIREVWRGVAEAYSPFNIDITTNPARYAAMPAGKRMRCILTPTYDWYSSSGGVQGVALRHSFARAGGLFASDTPCWIFVRSWYSYISLVTAHELGHTLGLAHDGLYNASTDVRTEYFSGHGSGPMSWGPIMGNPSYRNIAQWSKGEYANASNTEDDLAIITSATNGVTYYNDGNGKTRAAATAITLPSSGSVSKQGVITTGAHEAWFAFTLSAEKTISVSAAPCDDTPKLDIAMQLQSAAGAVLATDNPSLALNALIEKRLQPGVYYIKLQGSAHGGGQTEGYTRYGSIGQYTLIATASDATIAAPVITRPPQDTATHTAAANFTLTATATGPGTLRYQWQKNGADLATSARIADVTSASLTMLAPVAADAGQYAIKVRNAGGETTSAAATVTVTAPPPPSIVTHPQSKAVSALASSFTLSVSATGAGALSYQWQKDGVDLVSSSHYSGVNNATLYVYSPEVSDEGKYTVKVSNVGGETVSNPATVTITLPPPPTITTHPANLTNIEGQSTSLALSVSATGQGTLNFQWQKDDIDIEPDAHYSVTKLYSIDTISRLTINAYTTADSGRYRARVTNKGGSARSNEATVTITLPGAPVISTPPANRTALAGDYSVTFSVGAGGIGLRYQWQKNGVDLAASSHYSGVNSSVLSIYSLQTDDAGSYAVRVWNAGGERTSDAAVLTVNLPPVPTFRLQPSDLYLTQGKRIYLETSVTSQGSYSCQWYKDGQAIAGATSYSFLISSAAVSDSGTYKLAVTNPGGSTESNEVAVAVAPASAPVIITQPKDQTAYEGGSVTFSVFADGDPAPDYEWYRNGVKMTNSGPLLTVNNIRSGNTDKYKVVASNIAGSVTSDEVAVRMEPAAGGNGIGLFPEQKRTGCGRVVYMLQVNSAFPWTVSTDSPWLAFSKKEGNSPDFIEVTVAPNPLPVQRAAIVSVAGLVHTITQAPAGSVVRELWAAGNNEAGQLGTGVPGGSLQRRAHPVQIDADVRFISAGSYYGMYIKNDETLWTAGDNGYWKMGLHPVGSYPVPAQTAFAASFVAASVDHSMYVRRDGVLFGVGHNYERQVGSSSDYAPHIVSDVHRWTSIASGAVAVAAGRVHTLFIKSDGSLWGMGQNAGLVENGDSSYGYLFTPGKIAADAVAVAAGAAHGLYIKSDRTLWGMGSNYNYQFGQPASNELVFPPARIDDNVAAAVASGDHSLWIKNDGSLWAAGLNSSGQLGNGTNARIAVPARIATNIRAVSTNSQHTLYITNDNRLWAMGDNTHGQFGNGTFDSSNIPIEVAANVDAVSAGGNHTLFIATGDIRPDPPPPPVITGFSPANITTQTKVLITGSNFNHLAGVYFGSTGADNYTIDSGTQITAYAPIVPVEDGQPIRVGTFDGTAASATTYSAAYAPVPGDPIPDQLVRLGNTISIEAPVLGTPDPAIVWQVSTDGGATWADLSDDLIHSGVNTATLTISSAPLTITGNRYHFVATNAHGSKTGAPFTVIIAYPPSVTTHPVSQTVNAGASASFTAAFSGAPAPALQWEVSTNGGPAWTPVASATNATLTLNNINASMHLGQYRCVAENLHGTAVTDTAMLSVIYAPVHHNGITSQGVVAGHDVTLSADASGNPAPAYRWQISTNGGGTWHDLSDNINYHGASSDMLDISNVTTGMNGYKYRCVATNSQGGSNGASITLAVLAAQFSQPKGLAVSGGALYITDASLHTVQKVGLSNLQATVLAGATGQRGYVNGTGSSIRFSQPAGISVAGSTLYIADSGNNAVRYISTSGQAVSALRFSATSSNPITPYSVVSSAYGDEVCFSANPGHVIIGAIETVSGTTRVPVKAGYPGQAGYIDGTRSAARFNQPSGMIRKATGADLVVTDAGNHAIRLVSSSGSVSTIAGSGTGGWQDGTGRAAEFNSPRGLAADSSGNLYIADTDNSTIRRVSTAGEVITLAGNPGVHGLKDGRAGDAWFDHPHDVAYDSSGNLYIADTANAVIRRLNLATREVTTLAVTPVLLGTAGGGTGGNPGGGGGSTGGSGGGGGAPSPWFVIALAALGLLRLRRKDKAG
jgi:alpha-tubulin suppressor-like RCC1 family protein